MTDNNTPPPKSKDEGEKRRQSIDSSIISEENEDDETSSEEIYGAQFFGGSKVNPNLFDSTVEDDQAAELEQQQNLEYNRFQDTNAFPDDFAQTFGMALQRAVNHVLYDENNHPDDVISTSGTGLTVSYHPDLEWNKTPFPKTSFKDKKHSTKTNPFKELANALEFYNRLDLAIISAKSLSQTKIMEIRWEISVLWPNLWEARVLITGTSQLTILTNQNQIIITQQMDILDYHHHQSHNNNKNNDQDSGDIIKPIANQILPRFWDLYHLGMTPNAEQPVQIPFHPINTEFLPKYKMFIIPPRLVIQPSLIDPSGQRDGRMAQSIPNHAFTTIIKTTGPYSQRYVPVTPIEVEITKEDNKTNDEQKKGKSSSRITWTLPLPPQFVAAASALRNSTTFSEDGTDKPIRIKSEGCLPLPGPDVDSIAEVKDPSVSYKLTPKRLIATMPFSGNPQDIEVSEVRKELYHAVIIKAGWKPKLNPNGGPKFFFRQFDAKACFTSDGGLGMAVHSWRPDFVKSNEVGIELEYFE